MSDNWSSVPSLGFALFLELLRAPPAAVEECLLLLFDDDDEEDDGPPPLEFLLRGGREGVCREDEVAEPPDSRVREDDSLIVEYGSSG
jgi:hypothetical protein